MGTEMDNLVFEQIVQTNFERTFSIGAIASEAEVPFGLFTDGPADELTNGRVALATATGHTGNNGEESC